MFRRSFRGRTGRQVGLVGTAALLAACGQDRSTAPALRSPEGALGQVIVFPLNAVMAVGDTLTIQAHARTLSGEAITTFDSVEYIPENPTDTLRVHVSSTGVVTAVGPSGTGSPVLLEVIVFKDGLARADQAVLQITPTRITNPQISIQPVPPDSAKLAWGDSKSIMPAVFNSVGDTVEPSPMRLEFGPGDSLTLQCYAPTFVGTATITQAQLQQADCGTNGNAGQVGLSMIHVWRKGTAWVHVNAMVYNTVLRDSVQYTLSNPYGSSASMGPTYLLGGEPYRNSLFIAPGGTVYFSNDFPPSLGGNVTFTFENPAAATVSDPPSTYGDTTGNISTLQPYQYATRKFLTPGVYKWTGTVSGGIAPYTGATATGTITVE